MGLRLKRIHLYVFPQVRQNRLSVSKCRNYAQPTIECQSFFQGSVLQVTSQSHFLTCVALICVFFIFISYQLEAWWLYTSATCPVSMFLCNSVLSLQECHPNVCDRRGSLNSRGPPQLRRSTGSFCHQSLRSFSLGTSQTAHIQYMAAKKSDVQQPTLIWKKCNNKRRKYNKLIHHLKQKHPVYYKESQKCIIMLL